MPITDSVLKEKLRQKFMSLMGGDNEESKKNASIEFNNFENVITKFQENKIKNLFREKKVYEFNDKKYLYLSNDLLSRDFGFTLGNNDKPYDIRFGIYKLNGKCKEPFLSYLLEVHKTDDENRNIMKFPSFELSTTIFDDNEEEIRTLFEEECFRQFKPLTNNIGNDIIDDIYRGFIEEENNIIYVFFDCTDIEVVLNENHIWGILDEFVNEKRIYGNNYTEENISQLFQKNEFLAYITDENDERINIPCCLYLCKLNDGETDYENVYLEDIEPDENNYKIYHYVFGNNCLFLTTDPIEKDNITHLRTIRRFATFIDKSLYVLNINKDIENINFDEDNDDDDTVHNEDDEIPQTHEKYNCIYFFENYKQLWCIRDDKRTTEIHGFHKTVPNPKRPQYRYEMIQEELYQLQQQDLLRLQELQKQRELQRLQEELQSQSPEEVQSSSEEVQSSSEEVQPSSEEVQPSPEEVLQVNKVKGGKTKKEPKPNKSTSRRKTKKD